MDKLKEQKEIGMEVKKINRKEKNRLIIEFKGKKYSFSIISLIIFPIGAFMSMYFLIKFFQFRENFWLHEILANHQVFLMKLLFNVNAEVTYNPENFFPWGVNLPESVGVYINNGCTYMTSISIFAALIIFTPHSKDHRTSEDILWRKTVAIIISVVLIYIFNIFRMSIQVYLYHLGNPWSIVHDSTLTYFIIVVIHICIFFLLNRKIPELFVSFYYSGKLLYLTIKEKREKAIKIRFIKKD